VTPAYYGMRVTPAYYGIRVVTPLTEEVRTPACYIIV